VSMAIHSDLPVGDLEIAAPLPVTKTSPTWARYFPGLYS
jgi:hypothetical protein